MRSNLPALARFALRRLAGALVVAWLVATAVFLLLHAAPGDPADLFDHPGFGAETRAAVQRAHGLDAPVLEQYGRWLGALARGDLGVSFAERRPVAALLAEALPPTLLLGAAALAIELVLGTLAALVAAARPRSLRAGVLRWGALVLSATPLFWLALVALAVFSYRLGIFPPSHMHGAAEVTGAFARSMDLVHHLLLPSAVLGIAGAAATSLLLRGELAETLRQDFVRTARGKGSGPARLLGRHALRNALAPLCAVVGMALPSLVSGALVVEVIFAWPGVGRLAYSSLLARDYPVVTACALVAALATVAGSAAADILQALADPRVRAGEEVRAS